MNPGQLMTAVNLCRVAVLYTGGDMDRRFFIYLFNKSFVKLRKENFVFTQCRQCLYPLFIRFLNVFVLL